MAHNSNIYDDNLHVNERPLPPIGSTKQVKYDPPKRTAFWLLVTLCVLTSGLALSTIVLATGWTDGSPDVFIGADPREYIHWTKPKSSAANTIKDVFVEMRDEERRFDGKTVSIPPNNRSNPLVDVSRTDFCDCSLIVNFL
ncbi:unnamed protein product, partial [Mesorhabditis belari]|uniref:Uncharacterized protein n=1 Tax=Mesorhabditis belari TaxID=2138241 RepID=A0AAF3EIJ6_9BILA